MKKILFLLAITFSISASAQLDSTATVDSIMNSWKLKTLTVRVPVKVIILHGSFASEIFNWNQRKLPDYYKPLIGSGTKQDSLVTINITGENLADFVDRLTGSRHGAISGLANSIFNNVPAIAGYTSLFTQVVTLANGNGAQKNAAEYVVWRYNKYMATMTASTAEIYNRGLAWILN